MVETKAHQISVSDGIGEVSALINDAPDPFCLLTLAHGAGAGMGHGFMSSLAHELSLRGVTTVRFNFPFTEAGKKRPDFAPVAEKTIDAALRFARTHAPGLPLYASGKSFGGRMTSQLLSKSNVNDVKGIIFFGFPLHPAGQPSITRGEHLGDVRVPMLFLQGTKDALARLDLVKGVDESLPLSELQTFEGADHAFMRGKKSLVNELADAAALWLRNHCREG